jgi:hypothetical protein
MLKVFEEIFANLEAEYSYARGLKDYGAALKALDLIHQARIKQFEIETLLEKIKEQQQVIQQPQIEFTED